MTIIKDKVEQVLKGIRLLDDESVYVGIPEKKDARTKGKINNAYLGATQEFGSPKHNIPARPFLVPGVRDSEKRVRPQLRKAADAAMEGHHSEVMRRFNSAGMIAQNVVRAVINRGIAPPLKKSTIAARKRRGRTGAKPLIDTGQLRNSITYVIRKKNRSNALARMETKGDAKSQLTITKE